MKRVNPDCACCGRSTQGKGVSDERFGGLEVCPSCLVMLAPHWVTQSGVEFTRGRDPIRALEEPAD